MERLFQEVRHRKLDQMGAGYAVIAWIVVQAASIALPAFDAPPWLMRWLIVAAIAGLPAVLVFAWHHNDEIPLSPSRYHGVRRWALPTALLVVLAASLTQLAMYWSGLQARGEESSKRPVQASIAVLPFANLSGDPAKRYFSDGVSDQLITELSRRKSLRVAARTSSFALAKKDADVRTIARALNVAAIVEGSVREEGGRVRIAAELINAADGFQIWSATYDRQLTNILALQDEIARAISMALNLKLTGHAEPAAAAPQPPRKSIVPEAYRAYLQGQFYFAQRSEEGIAHAIEKFQEVTQLAPDYADGFAALGNARASLALNMAHMDEMAPALSAIKHALALDEKNPTAIMAHATISLLQWQWRTAADDLLRVEHNGIGTPTLWHAKGVFFSYMAMPMELTALEKAVQLDPLSYIDRYNYALYLHVLGRKAEALKVANDGLALQPGNMEGQQLVCEIEAGMGDVAAAKRIKAQLQSQTGPQDPPGPAVACAYYVALAENDVKTVRALADGVAQSFKQGDLKASDVGTAYARIGDSDKAIEWFNRSYDLREPWLPAISYMNPELADFFKDPRWIALRNQPKIIDWENARRELRPRFEIGE